MVKVYINIDQTMYIYYVNIYINMTDVLVKYHGRFWHIYKLIKDC